MVGRAGLLSKKAAEVAGGASGPAGSASPLDPLSLSAPSAAGGPSSSAWQPQLGEPMEGVDEESMALLLQAAAAAAAAAGGGGEQEAHAASSIFDEVVQQVPGGAQEKFSIQLESFMKSLQNRSFCEQALDMQPTASGKHSIVVRPGFEGEFRSRAHAYVTGERVVRVMAARGCHSVSLLS